ncbi:MAG TPA: methylase, partial [Alcanivorax sp.]|nr:methylase [Alcanivorax sp.]
MKPFSQAAENNKGPILDVLRDYLTAPGDLLEIGAGTGQHAVWLAPHFPQVLWTPTELP